MNKGMSIFFPSVWRITLVSVKKKKDLVMGVILNQVLAGFYYTSNRRFMENSEEQYLTKGPISISGYGTLPFILNWRKFASCRSKPKNLRKCHLVYYVTGIQIRNQKLDLRLVESI